MAESLPERNPDGSTPPPSAAKQDSHLRLVTEEFVVGPSADEPTDDTPTIISKGLPTSSQSLPAHPENLSTSLRGRRLAHFELLGPIGVGGMAAVLQARDTQLDRLVALKILPPEMAADPDNIQRFHQEARAAAKLDHENIARVFFCGEDQNLFFIAFEYVEGENLRTLLEKRGRLTVPEAVRYVLQIASGLEHATARGVVHRDIKPSNIIISPNGRAKLVDMGLARSLDIHKDQGLTQSGVTLGTYDYISPEQALEPREADARSDIYSLGCTFYHMLTGQAPVPEGTPAKKLHHHQHVAPLDPRQLNPLVPDEVALILARMMAKDPRASYQRPVHLVQHFLQAAHKVGAAPEVPEGLMFVEAPLPTTPRQRPLLMVSVAALALALVLAVLSLAPQQGPSLAPKPGPKVLLKDDLPLLPKNGGLSAEPVLVVTKPDQLKEMLADPKRDKIQIANNIDLPSGGFPYKGNAGRNLTLQSAADNDRHTIKFKVGTEGAEDSDVAGLTFDVEAGATVTVRNLTFQLESFGYANAPTAFVMVRGGGKVVFEKCMFIQRAPLKSLIELLKEHRENGGKQQPLASVLVDNSDNNVQRPSVDFKKCVFKGVVESTEGAQVAVQVDGPADIFATDCAFRPHLALFHVRGNHGNAPTALKLENCTAMVVYGPVFCLDDTAVCHIESSHSIFARPPDAEVPYLYPDLPDLVYQTVGLEPKLQYSGFENLYYNLTNLWNSGSSKHIGAARTEQHEFLKLKGVKDAKSQFAEESPFAKESPTKEKSDAVAFAVKAKSRDVRWPSDVKMALGVQHCVWGPQWVKALPPLTSDTVVAVNLKENERLYDPDYEGNDPRVYKSVEKAINNAEKGDVILIKHSKSKREIDIKPMRLDQVVDELTIKAYTGFKPVFTLAQTPEQDAAFFRLNDGKLTVEDLEFEVEPDQEFKALAVATIGGNAQCTFKNCVLTLKQVEPGKFPTRARLSIVTLTGLDEAMSMGMRSSRPFPEVNLSDCFVPGEGDLLTVRASRPFRLDIKNSLVGINGSLVQIQGPAKETKEGSPDSGPDGSISLQKSSFFVSEPLVWVKGNRGNKGLLPTRVESRDCLFAAMNERPLLLLDGTELTESNFRTLLDWKGERNAYCNFDKMLEHLRADDSLSTFHLNQPRWMQVFNEPETKFLATQFNYASSSLLRTLWLAEPSLFQPREENATLTPYGHHLNMEMLPKMSPPPKVDKAP